MFRTAATLAILVLVAAAHAQQPGPELAERKITSDTTLAGHRFMAPSWIYLSPGGELRRAWLGRDTDLQGQS